MLFLLAALVWYRRARNSAATSAMNRQVVPPIAMPAVCDLVNGAGPAGGGAAAEEDVVGAAPVGVDIGTSGRVGAVNGSFVACLDVFT